MSNIVGTVYNVFTTNIDTAAYDINNHSNSLELKETQMQIASSNDKVVISNNLDNSKIINNINAQTQSKYKCTSNSNITLNKISNKRKQSDASSSTEPYNAKHTQFLSLYTLDPHVLTQSICKRFNEPKTYIIEMVVKELGNPSTLKLYFETVRIQKNGGLLKQNGLRRSNGGVFMELFKNKLTNKEWKIFNNRIKEEDKLAKNRKSIELDSKLADEIDKLLLNGEDMENVDD